MKLPNIVKTSAVLLSLALFAAPVFAQRMHGGPGKTSTIASTVPSNGDLNPYGLVRVPKTTGSLVEGNLLISNFNDSNNLQGTGTTIVQITPGGTVTLFSQINANTLPGSCPGGVGLTTALSVLKTGWVIVGSLPTTDGTSATAQAGCLLVLDSNGNVVETFYGSLINGPWDMATWDDGGTANLFVTNVLNGTVAGGGNIVRQGTVVRITINQTQTVMPSIESMTVVGSGFAERTDPAALVIGPTGAGLSPDGSTLYVADALFNRVVAIPEPLTRVTSAGNGAVVLQGADLDDPLGLAVATNGNILVTNGANGFLLTITPDGSEIGKNILDENGTPPGNGALFGVVGVPGWGIYYVDDATNTLNLFN